MPQLVVGAIIVDSFSAPTRVLAARRTAPAALAGKWEFPGGKVEVGESHAAALVREIREELGVRIAVRHELVNAGSADGTWPISEKYELRLLFAQVQGQAEPVAGDDHDAVRWLGLDELDSVDWLPSDEQAIPALHAALQA